jgi:hypothetical protein
MRGDKGEEKSKCTMERLLLSLKFHYATAHMVYPPFDFEIVE